MLPRKLAQATNLKSTHYCVTMIQCIKYGLNLSFSSRNSVWKHNFGQNLKLQSAGVTLN